jgi:hypothetical protein
MRRFTRQIVLATLIALYGGVTALAPALHGLAGLAHNATPINAAKGGGDGQIATLVSAHGDCPVCHFLAQGQIVNDPDQCGRIEIAQVRPADEIPAVAPPDVQLLTHPRAPPLI